ncbi:GNAT family N-acetyltransferase [Alloscardovia macacae]|uniref:GNAT family N-acetyltransferase n=1 Tax=Alloscardovia macacae TaxID=1160091 RepID=A0A261F564_9BIFI|nr:GNAT family N-acetyltransferase [Alloscardovia macacae]OZG54250.1 GNAT family N-acetyltransferase [Alloscardovia macacae]
MAQIQVRRTTRDDLAEIMDIVNAAKALLKDDGSSQWQNGYPNEYTFIADIEADASYVLTVDGQVAATAMLSLGEEAGYSKIYGGQVRYPSAEYGTFGVLHRVAVSPNFRGMGLVEKLCVELFREMRAEGIRVARVDTHRKNVRMQRVLERLGMTQCGFITLDHDPEDPVRVCYEGLVENLLGLVE